MNKYTVLENIKEYIDNKYLKAKSIDLIDYDLQVELILYNEIVNLQHQLEEKDKIIDEIEKRCNQEINAATIQYERHKKSDIWQYIIAHKRILEILERGKNGK